MLEVVGLDQRYPLAHRAVDAGSVTISKWPGETFLVHGVEALQRV